MDSIIDDVGTRSHPSSKIFKEFSADSKIGQISEDKVASLCKPFIIKYTKDLTSEFKNEVRHFNCVYADTFPPSLFPLGLLNAIHKLQPHSIFGKIWIDLQIFCTLPVTVADKVSALSKLNLIKFFRGLQCIRKGFIVLPWCWLKHLTYIKMN